MTGAFGEEIVQYKGFQTKADIGEGDGRKAYLGAYRYRACGEMQIRPDGKKVLNITDNNGSVRLVVIQNSTGFDTLHYDYKPFGDTLWTSAGTMNRDNFDGSIYDAESNLQMLGFRMYENETGRFTTPDLLWSAFPAQTPYHYAYNSPLTYRDPSGLAPEKEKEREELMTLFTNPFSKSYRLEDDIDREGLSNNAFYNPWLAPVRGLSIQDYLDMKSSIGGGGGGSRTGGSTSSGENGQGGQESDDNVGNVDYFDLEISEEDWLKMPEDEKNATIEAANKRLKEKADGKDEEWSYVIFGVKKKDGTTTVVITNYKTDHKRGTVTFDYTKPKGDDIESARVIGDGHSHGLTNGDHSGQDLYNLYLLGTCDGYLSVVVGSETNYFLQIGNIDYFHLAIDAANRINQLNGYRFRDYYPGWMQWVEIHSIGEVKGFIIIHNHLKNK